MIDENACVSRAASVTDVWPQVQAVLHALAYRHTTVNARFLLLPLLRLSLPPVNGIDWCCCCGFAVSRLHACMHACISIITHLVGPAHRERERVCTSEGSLSLPSREWEADVAVVYLLSARVCPSLSLWQPVCEDWRTGDCEVGSLPAPTHHLHLHSLARSLACVG